MMPIIMRPTTETREREQSPQRTIIINDGYDDVVLRVEHDDEPTIPLAKLPVARLKAPWWRRLLARLFAKDIAWYCGSCDARMSSAEDGECFWCRSMKAAMEPEPDHRVSTQEAADAFDRLAQQIRHFPSTTPIARPHIHQTGVECSEHRTPTIVRRHR